MVIRSEAILGLNLLASGRVNKHNSRAKESKELVVEMSTLAVLSIKIA